MILSYWSLLRILNKQRFYLDASFCGATDDYVSSIDTCIRRYRMHKGIWLPKFFQLQSCTVPLHNVEWDIALPYTVFYNSNILKWIRAICEFLAHELKHYYIQGIWINNFQLGIYDKDTF